MNRFQAYKKSWKKNEDGDFIELAFDRDDAAHVRQRFLWWQEKGLMETPTGYGNALRTTWEVFKDGRWRRMYCTLHGNIGTTWIVLKGEPVLVDIM